MRDDSFSYQHFGKIEKQVPDAPVVESMPTNAELLRASSAPSLMVANPTSNKAFASPFDGRRVSAVWSRLPRFADNSQGPQSRAHQPSHGAHFRLLLLSSHSTFESPGALADLLGPGDHAPVVAGGHKTEGRSAAVRPRWPQRENVGARNLGPGTCVSRSPSADLWVVVSAMRLPT